MTIEISPLDTLFFKDAKPFNASDESWSDTIFPPNPSTIYGALRAIYFRNNPNELSKANEDNDPTKDLTINKIYLKISKNYYFPLPLDIVHIKNQTTYSYLLQRKKSDFISNLKTDTILFKDNDIENFENSFLSLKRFQKYQTFKNDEFIQINEIKSLDDFIINEPKIGIKINKNTKTVEEGFLYRVDFKRLQNAKIVVEFNGLDIEDSKLMKFGGEGKMATLTKVEDLEINRPSNIGKIFKLYFLTPSIFDKGWLPSWIDEKSLEGNFKGLKLKLLTASIGKYKLIGGFDMKKREPKIMHRAIPEGSIYYFELLSGDTQKVIDTFHNKAISDKLAEEGYGVTFIGEAK